MDKQNHTALKTVIRSSHITANLPVCPHTEFHQSSMIHVKMSVLYKIFLNFTAVKYSLHKCSKIMLHQK